MKKELQDRVWRSLPEEFRGHVRRMYNADVIAENRMALSERRALLIDLFGVNHLTSDGEGDEKQSELLKYIRERQRAGKVVLATVEGLMECGIEELVDQPVDGLLYDLNRNEATSYALGGKRAVNDIAVAQVIRHLHAKVSGHGKGSEKGAGK